MAQSRTSVGTNSNSLTLALLDQVYGKDGILARPIAPLSRLRYSVYKLISYLRTCRYSLENLMRELRLRFVAKRTADSHQHIVDGILCLDLKTVERPSSDDNCRILLENLEKYKSIFTHSDLEIDTRNDRELVTRFVQIPRDILLLYTEKDPDIIRKIELHHCVHIFYGRDFERFRDRDVPSAPRGKVTFVLYGALDNVESCKLELASWLDFQGDFKQEEIVVPDHAAGSVIGRQGKHVAQIQSRAQARIDVMTDEKSRNGEAVRVLISGRRPGRDIAKYFINRSVEHSERMREKDELQERIREVREQLLYRNDKDREEDYDDGNSNGEVANWGSNRVSFGWVDDEKETKDNEETIAESGGWGED